ncbi:hypothetical protein OAO55_02685 [Bacteroidales bacterium]|nr:hypothetical protein [Bacteroidales bacterium]
MKHTLLIITVLSIFSFGYSQPYFKKGEDPSPTNKSWTPVEKLSDDFEGNNVDTAKWQINPVGNDWAWIGRAPGLFRAENVTVDKGNLRVTVGKLDEPYVKNGRTFTHQGGIIRSIAPGGVGMYFEAKMKANATVMSSTFWLMSKYDCHKKQETDIQECVGRTTDSTDSWAKTWDKIYHSNSIHRPTKCVEKLQLQGSVPLEKENYKKYYVYGMWWKSDKELMFFLDGKYVYTINPKIEWDMPAWIHMAIETYDWNPIPPDGGLVESGTWEQRTTQYQWVRTWKLKE